MCERTQYTVHSISVFPDKIIGMVPYHTVGSATVYIVGRIPNQTL